MGTSLPFFARLSFTIPRAEMCSNYDQFMDEFQFITRQAYIWVLTIVHMFSITIIQESIFWFYFPKIHVLSALISQPGKNEKICWDSPKSLLFLPNRTNWISYCTDKLSAEFSSRIIITLHESPLIVKVL